MLLPTAPYSSGDGSGVIFCSGSNARAIADLALVAGLVDEAAALYADAVIVNSRLGARPYVALSRLGWAKALRRRATDHAMTALRTPQDLAVAANLTKQAAAEFRRLDMPGPLHDADQLLTRLVADGQADNPLTTREAEIADWSSMAWGTSSSPIASSCPNGPSRPMCGTSWRNSTCAREPISSAGPRRGTEPRP